MLMPLKAHGGAFSSRARRMVMWIHRRQMAAASGDDSGPASSPRSAYVLLATGPTRAIWRRVAPGSGSSARIGDAAPVATQEADLWQTRRVRARSSSLGVTTLSHFLRKQLGRRASMVSGGGLVSKPHRKYYGEAFDPPGFATPTDRQERLLGSCAFCWHRRPSLIVGRLRWTGIAIPHVLFGFHVTGVPVRRCRCDDLAGKRTGRSPLLWRPTAHHWACIMGPEVACEFLPRLACEAVRRRSASEPPTFSPPSLVLGLLFSPPTPFRCVLVWGNLPCVRREAPRRSCKAWGQLGWVSSISLLREHVAATRCPRVSCPQRLLSRRRCSSKDSSSRRRSIPGAASRLPEILQACSREIIAAGVEDCLQARDRPLPRAPQTRSLVELWQRACSLGVMRTKCECVGHPPR